MKKIILLLLFVTAGSIAQVTAFPPDAIRICDENNPGDEIEVFDLTINEDQILNGQMGLTITYHLTSGAALGGAGAFNNPEMYTNISNPQLIFIRVQGNGGWDVTTMEIEVVPYPEAENLPQDITIDEGDGDGQAVFDLTVNEDLMLGGQFAIDFIFTYHVAQADCDNGTFAIVNPTMFTNFENPQEIYVRMQNALADCFTCYNYRIMSDGTLGVLQNDLEAVSFYPNPVNTILSFDASQFSGETVLSIYNLQGQLMTSEILIPENRTVEIDVSNLNRGVYFVQLISEGNQIIQQIIKE
ncbi:MAG: T9SS type A sorting domain-containing protein [Patiriisocius sp.]|uniref:T9SS type A sorting domain-containing protein n=1 Tax=Patiriisocius sp. TaxID=2822396 RepID=UPI003EFAC0F6